MDSLVDSYFVDLKRKKCSAWKACHGELLTIARRIINANCRELSELAKSEIENDSVRMLYNAVDNPEKEFKTAQLLKAFLKATVRNKTIDEAKRINKLQHLATTDATGVGAGPVPDYLMNEVDPAKLLVLSEEQAKQRKDLDLMAEALEEVGSPCKEFLTQRYLEDAKEREIAERHGLGTSSMHNRIKTCLKKMHEIFHKKLALREVAAI